MRILIAAVLTLAAIAARAQAQTATDRIVLERTPCFGWCPAYSVEISRSGLVTFIGKSHVKTKKASRQISPSAFRSLVTRFDRAGFFRLNDSYRQGDPGCKSAATDHPSAMLSVVDGKRKKTIPFYYGCSHKSVGTDLHFKKKSWLGTLDSLSSLVDSVAIVDEWAATGGVRIKPLHNYAYIARERELLKTSPRFLSGNEFEGVQVMYTWAELEPAKDRYDFSKIREDMAMLNSKNKKLWVQLGDVSFSSARTNVPSYLTTDSAYHGGVAQQYQIPGDDDSKAKPAGFVARRWDPAVRVRFQKLFSALGKEFDGKIAGINLTETSITFGSSGKFFPPGWKREEYPSAIIANATALKKAFPNSIVIQYANFMPGEWRPTNDRGYLGAVYRAAVDSGFGVGGPDLMPYNVGQRKSSYDLIEHTSGFAFTGIAVQDDNLAETNPATGKPVTVSELLDFALNKLRVDYIFWGTQEPYFSRDVVPTLSKREKH